MDSRSGSQRSIAVVLASYNRMSCTARCLQSLEDQALPDGVYLRKYLYDAGSTDGTAKLVSRTFPEVAIIQGSSDTYWNGGMRAAIVAAAEGDPDYFFWLNDDVFLDPHAIRTLLATSMGRSEGAMRAIAVGTLRDPTTGEITYGGMRRSSRWHPFRFELVEPQPDRIVEADTFNGNAVLVPASVYERIGNLEIAFSHGMGDFDYGLRAKAAAVEVRVAPGTVGTCARNSTASLERRGVAGAKEFLRQASDPKGLPLDEWLVFARRHGGRAWPIFWLSPYIKGLFRSFMGQD